MDLIFEVLQERKLRKCWQFPSSFTGVHLVLCISDKSGAFLFLPWSHQIFFAWFGCKMSITSKADFNGGRDQPVQVRLPLFLAQCEIPPHIAQDPFEIVSQTGVSHAFACSPRVSHKYF